MLKEIRLSGWKSFVDSTLYIDPLTILIGANASGKSNTLDALQFLQRVASGAGIFQAINGDAGLSPIRGGIEWVCHRPDRRFMLTVILEGDSENRDYRYQLAVQVNGVKAEVAQEELSLLDYGADAANPKTTRLFHTLEPEPGMTSIPVSFHTGARGRGRNIELGRSHPVLVHADTLKLRSEAQEGIRRVLAALQNIFVFDPVPSHMRGYAALSERLETDGSNIAGVLAALEPGRRAAVEQALTHYLRALPERDILRVWTEAVGKFQSDAMLYCEEGWQADSSQTVDARGMSDGSLRYLGIGAAMLTRQPGSLLVVEEVDNGLHPSRAHVLLDMLRTLGRERSIDVIVTTHNPALLDAAGARMTPFITVAHRDAREGFSVLTQLEDIRALPKLMAGGTLGQLSAGGRIEAALKQGAPT